ncbi:hypothetical protein Kpho02_63840 [Kitasatospora phosalacinea]|uniref:Uncharacterized protein n=1 Tax=Kitasatospora phosalacinea TaxID=2065 RepID=A0A9W6V3W4_9ACTN|nr:hypothetical protein [Kitasatospora phosalacinea]GLW74086.1 hypothetical protein Kpho02_63840 [Kitasatospora phosalacinea]
MRRGAALAAALLLVGGPAAGPAFADEGAPQQGAPQQGAPSQEAPPQAVSQQAVEELVAQAFDGDRPLPDAAAVARGCGRDYGCGFRFIPGLTAERTAAVVSVGNTVINCTNKKISVFRTVVLESSATDNLAGEISGSATVEGTVDNTTNVSGTAAGSSKTENSHTDITAPKDKGPNTDTTNGTTTTTSGSVTGSGQLKLTATAAFQMAFKAAYSHEWKRTNTESTQVKFTVGIGEELQFGMLSAMTRTVGVLSVDGTGTTVKNIVVTSPSSSNISTVVAQTFNAKDYCLTLRPQRSLPGAEDGVYEGTPHPADQRPLARYRLTDGKEWARTD